MPLKQSSRSVTRLITACICDTLLQLHILAKLARLEAITGRSLDEDRLSIRRSRTGSKTNLATWQPEDWAPSAQHRAATAFQLKNRCYSTGALCRVANTDVITLYRRYARNLCRPRRHNNQIVNSHNMDRQKFHRIAESLRQYRRADLGDFEAEVGPDPVEATYVDPLPDNAVLQIALSSSTTFLLGRKGTGKSTIFARAQSEIRRQNKNMSVYVDVKSLNEVLASEEAGVSAINDANIQPAVLYAHRLRKTFLGAVLADLIDEVDKSFDRLSLYDRWLGKRREYSDVRESLQLNSGPKLKPGRCLLRDTDSPRDLDKYEGSVPAGGRRGAHTRYHRQIESDESFDRRTREG